MDLENDAILIIYKDGNILELKKTKGSRLSYQLY